MIPVAPSRTALEDLVTDLQQQPPTPEVDAAITKIRAQIAHLAPASDGPARTAILASATKVGPKGYIHGWIYVGDINDVGARVYHPQLGQGRVRPHTGGHGVEVQFGQGNTSVFHHRPGTGHGRFVAEHQAPGPGPWRTASGDEAIPGTHIAALTDQDTPEQRHEKLQSQFRELDETGIAAQAPIGPDREGNFDANPNADRARHSDMVTRHEAVLAHHRAHGVPQFAHSSGTPEQHADLAQLWPSVRAGTEQIAPPPLRVTDQQMHGIHFAPGVDRNHVQAFLDHSGVLNVRPDYLNHARAAAAPTQRDWDPPAREGVSELESTLHHEYGHHLATHLPFDQSHAMMSEIAGAIPGMSRLDPDTNLKDWVTRNEAAITAHVGAHASYDHQELVADLWREYRITPQPSPAAQVVGRYLTTKTVRP